MDFTTYQLILILWSLRQAGANLKPDPTLDEQTASLVDNIEEELKNRHVDVETAINIFNNEVNQ